MKGCCIRRMGVALFTCLIAIGCVPRDRQPVPADKPYDAGYQTAEVDTLIEEGRQVYTSYCVGCHGDKGDGRGPAARRLHPRPRDFTQANFKFSSRRSGELPTERDIFETITNGLRGSSMPPWKLLPERQRWSVVAYIKTFSDKWSRYAPAPAIPRVEDPYGDTRDKSAAIARGEAVYHGLASCWTCHPAYVSVARINDYLEMFESRRRESFRDDISSAVARLSREDQVVFVPDFTRDFVRAGETVDVLYRSIAAGITGTAMPTWVDSLDIPSSEGDGLLSDRSDLWAIAYYVQSLIRRRPPLLAEGEFSIRNRAYSTDTGDWEPAVASALRTAAGGDTGGEGDEEEEEEWDDGDDGTQG